MERWAKIMGYPDYEISDYGSCKNVKTGRILKKRYKNRRVQYVLYNHTGNKNLSAHRLVAFVFVKKVSGKPDINHIDGNPNNNYYLNLEWCTKSENSKHSYKNGLQTPKYVLSDIDLSSIRDRYAKRKRGDVNSICEEYGISRTTLHDNLNNKTRK